jgi:hypothetical protein
MLARRQLMALGLSRHAIQGRVERRRLRRAYRGVYTVRQGPVGREGWWMGAVLLGGTGAVLSHTAAAARLGVRRSAPERTEVTVPTERRQCETVRFHFGRIESDEVTVRDGIPVTSLTRTLFDLASVLPRSQVEAAINEAEVMRLTDSLSLADMVARYPRRRGVSTIREILAAARIGASRTRSELEIAFLEFLDAVGLPRPEMNAWIQLGDKWIQVDCLWREQMVIAELDSHRFHMTPRAFESDRARDRALSAAEWRPIRITWRHLQEAAELERDLRTLLLEGPAAALRPGRPDKACLRPPASAL